MVVFFLYFQPSQAMLLLTIIRISTFPVMRCEKKNAQTLVPIFFLFLQRPCRTCQQDYDVEIETISEENIAKKILLERLHCVQKDPGKRMPLVPVKRVLKKYLPKFVRAIYENKLNVRQTYLFRVHNQIHRLFKNKVKRPTDGPFSHRAQSCANSTSGDEGRGSASGSVQPDVTGRKDAPGGDFRRLSPEETAKLDPDEQLKYMLKLSEVEEAEKKALQEAADDKWLQEFVARSEEHVTVEGGSLGARNSGITASAGAHDNEDVLENSVVGEGGGNETVGAAGKRAAAGAELLGGVGGIVGIVPFAEAFQILVQDLGLTHDQEVYLRGEIEAGPDGLAKLKPDKEIEEVVDELWCRGNRTQWGPNLPVSGDPENFKVEVENRYVPKPGRYVVVPWDGNGSIRVKSMRSNRIARMVLEGKLE